MAEPEDDSTLVLLDHLDSAAEGEWEGEADQQYWDDGEEVRHQTRSILAVWYHTMVTVVQPNTIV